LDLVAEHDLAVARSCRAVGLSRSSWYRPAPDPLARDGEIVEAMNAYFEKHPRRGFWKCVKRFRTQGRRWNHKRLWRIYCALGLNLRRKTKRRVPVRDRVPLTVPSGLDQVWSADFMADSLYCGVRFRTFNVLDDFNREAVAIEVDTSITGSRLVRLFSQLQAERGLPATLRTDNGPEFLGTEFRDWAEAHGMAIQYIQPGKPNQNAFIERFNRTYREEVLDLYLFEDLDQVRDETHRWLQRYNESWPYDSLGDLSPLEYAKRARVSTFELST
jgi:putative transposase